MWGSKKEGYEKDHLPAPKAILMGYGAISTDTLYDGVSKVDLADKGAALGRFFLAAIGGSNYTKEGLRRYSGEYLVDADYPPCYFVHAKDDVLVPFETAIVWERALQAQGIDYRAHYTETGGHGFALGLATEAEGWLEKAIAFWQAQ